MAALKIALLGAAGTGKTALAHALAAALNASGRRALAAAGPSRRAGTLQQQIDQLTALAETARPGWLIAEATPLLSAVDCELRFADSALYAPALAHQRSYDLTLLLGLDLAPAHPDMPMCHRVDQLLRQALARGGIAYQVIYGQDGARLQQALAAIDGQAFSPAPAAAGRGEARTHWVWACDKCSDPQCEHRLLTDLIAGRRAAQPVP